MLVIVKPTAVPASGILATQYHVDQIKTYLDGYRKVRIDLLLNNGKDAPIVLASLDAQSYEIIAVNRHYRGEK